MGSISLELISNGPIQYQKVGVASYVKKPLERFLFKKKLNEGAVPLEYFQNIKVNASNSIFVLDRSGDSYRNRISEERWNVHTGKSLSTEYKEIVATDILGIDVFGNEIPLFYRHDLHEETVEVDIQIISNEEGVSGFVFKTEIEKNALYVNQKNKFNKMSGRYSIVMIEEVLKDGSSLKKIMDAKSAIREATWKDINLETGKIENSKVLEKEKTNSGYKYTFQNAEKIYWKGESKNVLKISSIKGEQSNENWYASISNGETYRNKNGKGYKYYVPEYNQQNFFPAKPFSNSTFKEMQYVNENILFCNLQNVSIQEEMPVDIFVFDEDNELIEVFTNNKSKEGKEYREGIAYTSNVIESWDSENGLIYLNKNINSLYTYKANVFYEKDTFELIDLNLNPILNSKNRQIKYVVYCIPNCSIWERSINYLTVNRNDTIEACSQGKGLTYNSLQEIDGEKVNEESVIGKKYSIGDESFLKNYSYLGDNEHQYIVLGEIYLNPSEDLEEYFTFQLERNRGYFKNPKEVFRKNKNISQSSFGYGVQGLNYPENKISIIEIPIELLKDYGGYLTEEEIRVQLDMFSQSSLNKILRFKYTKANAVFTGNEYECKFTFDDIMPNEKIHIFKKIDGSFVEVDETIEKNWIDLEAKRKIKEEYKFQVSRNGLRYPKSEKYEVVLNE